MRDAPPDTAANLRAGLASLAAAAAAGARLVVFPELYLSGYYLDHAMARRAAEGAAALDRLQAAVDETGTNAAVGAALLGGRGRALPPAGPAGAPLAAPLPSGDVLLNTVAVLRPRRQIAYAIKAHLYPGEEEWFTPGQDLWSGRIAGWPCGIAVCYEIGFPEVSRSLALAGARLILVPAAFGRRRARVWDVLTRARAIENGCYLAAAGQSGVAGGREFLGRSRVVDPFGEVIAGLRRSQTRDDADAGAIAGPGYAGTPPVSEARPRAAQSYATSGAHPIPDPAVDTAPLRVGAHMLYVADLHAGRVGAARRGDDGWHRSLADRRPRLYASLSQEHPERASTA